MSTWVWLAVAASGAVGAPLRTVVEAAVTGRRHEGFPFGTLVVNLTGSLVFGLVTGLALYHAFPATPKLVLGSGLCGAYTTFSTFTFETAVLQRRGQPLLAATYVATSLVAGCLAAAFGLALAAL